MTKILTIAITFAVCAASFSAASAPAEAASKKARSSAALADAPHDARFERGYICYVDHYHYGSSTGQASRKAAEASAIGSWEGFVDFEYGSAWARLSKAGSKRMSCDQSAGGWGCNVEARPCK